MRSSQSLVEIDRIVNFQYRGVAQSGQSARLGRERSLVRIQSPRQMKTISRDGKQRRPRKGDPLFLLDKGGRRHVIPTLDKIVLRYEWSRFSNRRLQFHFMLQGKKYDVFDSYISLETRQRERMLFNAAIAFCQDVLDMDETISALRESSIVKPFIANG